VDSPMQSARSRAGRVSGRGMNLAQAGWMASRGDSGRGRNQLDGTEQIDLRLPVL
jgi:hypothetical protein